MQFLLLLFFMTAVNALKLGLNRRLGAKMGAILAAASLTISPALAMSEGTKTYTDPLHGVSIAYPWGWQENKADLSGERTVNAFTNPSDSSASVSVVYTPIPADFTKLTSFGDLDGYLIPKGDGVTTEVISKVTKGERVTLEYITTAPNNPKRHVITVFALRPAEGVVGVTAQSEEATFKDNKTVFAESISSLKM